MARDYHEEAREIARRLLRDGLAEEAATLVEAIEGGATGTEILVALRWHLGRILEAHPTLAPETRRRMRDLRRAIDAALG